MHTSRTADKEGFSVMTQNKDPINVETAGNSGILDVVLAAPPPAKTLCHLHVHLLLTSVTNHDIVSFEISHLSLRLR